MKIAFLVYHDVLDDRVMEILGELKIDSYTKWDNVTGKFQGADPLLGTRTYPGMESVRLIPITDDGVINSLVEKLEDFNKKAHKHNDELRLYLLPLEKIV